MSARPPPVPPDADRDLRELDARIERFARRRAHARSRRGRSLWAQASAVGTLGWLIAVPIVLGALLGHLLDRYLGSGITWAMAFMFLGVLVAGYSLWKLAFDTRMDEEREQRAAEAAARAEAEVSDRAADQASNLAAPETPDQGGPQS